MEINVNGVIFEIEGHKISFELGERVYYANMLAYEGDWFMDFTKRIDLVDAIRMVGNDVTYHLLGMKFEDCLREIIIDLIDDSNSGWAEV